MWSPTAVCPKTTKTTSGRVCRTNISAAPLLKFNYQRADEIGIIVLSKPKTGRPLNIQVSLGRPSTAVPTNIFSNFKTIPIFRPPRTASNWNLTTAALNTIFYRWFSYTKWPWTAVFELGLFLRLPRLCRSFSFFDVSTFHIFHLVFSWFFKYRASQMRFRTEAEMTAAPHYTPNTVVLRKTEFIEQDRVFILRGRWRLSRALFGNSRWEV